MPYTYLIGWTQQDKWYIGARFINSSPAEQDLWNEYPTSSGHVKRFREMYGEPDHVEVLQEFDTQIEASHDEVRRQLEANVLNDDRYLNGAIIHSDGLIEYWGKHLPKSEEHVRKVVQSIKETRERKIAEFGPDYYHQSEQAKSKTSETLKERYADADYYNAQVKRIRDRMSDPEARDAWLEQIHSEESRQKRSTKRKDLLKDPAFVSKHAEGVRRSFEENPDHARKISEKAKARESVRVKCGCGYESNRLTMSRHKKKCELQES